MATAKSKKTKKRRSSKRNNSLSKLSLSQMVKDIKKPALFVIGLIAGKQVGLIVDKFTNKVEGIVGIDGKALVKPLAEIGVGLAFSQIVQNKDFKMVGYGIAAHGSLVMMKDVFDKDLLSGLNGDEVIDYNPQELPPASPDLNLPELTETFDKIDKEIEGLSNTEEAPETANADIDNYDDDDNDIIIE